MSRYAGWENFKGLPEHRIVAAVTATVTTRASTARKSTARSSGVAFDVLCELSNLPKPVAEFRFHPERKWRFDYAWPPALVALEIHGGTFVQGKHSRGAGQRIDFEKWSAAAALGWRILHVIPEQLESVQTIMWLKECLR